MKTRIDWSKAKKRARLVLILLTVFVPLKMFMEVMRMPEFKGSTIYVEHSPDGAYKGLTLYLPNSWLNREQAFSDIFFDSGDKTWGVLMDAKTEDVLGFYSFGEDWDIGGRRWTCDESRLRCSERYFGYEKQGAKLPPSLWRRIHALLVVHFRGFDIPKIQPNKIYCEDKPVHPPITVVCTNEPKFTPD